MNDDLARFRGNCFQFACDKLDPQEHAWMVQMLERHPDWQAHVDAERELVHLARAGLERHHRPLVSFDEVSRLLAQQTRQEPWHARLAAWWQGLAQTPSSHASRWAVAAAVTLGVALLFQMRHLVQDDAIPDEGYRAAQPAGQGEPVILRVQFRSDLTMGELVARLDSMHLRIRSGPDAQGVYELSVSGAPLSEAVDQLRASGLTTRIEAGESRERESR